MKARYSPTQAYRPRKPPETVEDRDACALYASVSKTAQATHEAIETALVALEKMLHRAGNVVGEGDGCGLLVDIPREIWAEEIRAGGHASKLALDPRFAVLHVFIPRKSGAVAETQAKALEIMSRTGLRVLATRENAVDTSALGPQAREEEPVFWQIGGLIEDPRLCFDLTIQLEAELDLHVASSSTDTCVYKVLGAPAALGQVDPQHPRLLAQLRDRVDLAVVAEHAERLHPLERRPGVRRVAVVPDHRGRLGAAIVQVRVVAAEHRRGSHHLVHAGVG